MCHWRAYARLSHMEGNKFAKQLDCSVCIILILGPKQLYETHLARQP